MDFDNVSAALAAYPGTRLIEANGDLFAAYDPEGRIQRDPSTPWMPWATIVTSNINDSASDLGRAGVFRLNIGLTRHRFTELTDQVEVPDFTAVDVVMPHPVYADYGWVCVLNPDRTWPTVEALLAEAHERAVRKHDNAARRRTATRQPAEHDPDQARSVPERCAAARERLGSPGNLWLATSDGQGPHLIPVSYWWDGTQLTTATFEDSRTHRNARVQPNVRVSLGTTTDVLMIDATAAVVTVADIDAAAADGYARTSGVDPRSVPGWVYLRLAPQRMQLWSGPAEFSGRTIMRDGAWLDDPIDSPHSEAAERRQAGRRQP